MKIGLHLTTYNRKRFTEECLKSIIWSKPKNSKILIIDNASTDDTYNILNEYFRNYPDLIENVIFNDKNYHLGAAIIQGWTYLKDTCDILCCINNDFLLEPGWEENVISCFSEIESLDYITGTVRPDREKRKKKTPSGNGQYTTISDVGAAYFILTKHFTEGNFNLLTKPFTKNYVGPGPVFYKSLQENKLKGVRLAHPGVLVRHPEYSHPEHIEYYNETFRLRNLEKNLKKWRYQEKIGKTRGVINWRDFILKYHPDKAGAD